MKAETKVETEAMRHVEAGSLELGSQLRGRRIFLTGGTGFFGKSILSMVRRKLFSGISWTVLSRHPERLSNQYPEFANLPNVRFVAGDVRDFSFDTPELRETYDDVIHAATSAVSMLPPGEMTSVVVDGTRHVIEFAKRVGAKRLMMTSSGGVYGAQPPELSHIPEEFPCHPITEYGHAKLAAEQLCVDSGLWTLLPRCFAFVGPYLNRDIHFAIGNFIGDCLANRPIIIRGDGTPYRSYLYADELVVWLLTILAHGQNGRVYHVGSDEAISIHDLAKRVRKNLGSTNEIQVLGTPAPHRQPARYVPRVERAKIELGLSIEIGLDEAIRRSATQPSP